MAVVSVGMDGRSPLTAASIILVNLPWQLLPKQAVSPGAPIQTVAPHHERALFWCAITTDPKASRAIPYKSKT
jgi:hypothetical protein